MKTKDFDFSVKTVSDDGFFSGYGSVFDVKDSSGDVVRRGAFTDSLAGKMPKLLWQHDSRQPIGVWERIEEDDYGLKMEGRLLIADVVKAREAYALLKAGAIDGLSIGYSIVKERYDEEMGINELLSVKLWETSVVTFPANGYAVVNAVKEALGGGRLPSLKEFERFLRDAGFSKTQACTIASHGLRVLTGEPCEASSVGDVLAALKQLNKEFNHV